MGELGGIDIPADGNDSGQGNDGGVNPAWNDVLGVIPQELHNQVIPHFRKWDTNSNSRANSIHEQYAGYKAFADNQISPQDLHTGYGLYQALNQDPQRVYDAIAEHFGLGGVVENDGEDNEDGESSYNLPPEIRQQLQQFEMFKDNVSQLLLKQQEDALSKQAEENLEKELSALKGKHGDFDEGIVLSLMASGMKGEEAVTRYNEVVNTAKTQTLRPKVPPMLGNSGSIPQGGNDPTKLKSDQVRNLVAQYLENGGR